MPTRHFPVRQVGELLIVLGMLVAFSVVLVAPAGIGRQGMVEDGRHILTARGPVEISRMTWLRFWYTDRLLLIGGLVAVCGVVTVVSSRMMRSKPGTSVRVQTATTAAAMAWIAMCLLMGLRGAVLWIERLLG